MSLLDQSIVKTLSYFDIFNYPLTTEELFAYWWQPSLDGMQIGYEGFLKNLENIDKEKIKYQAGYYFLAGKEDNIYKRNEGLLFSLSKMKIARRAAKKIRSVPFLKAVFVCNSVAFGQANADSDIDFFIITEKKRIWLVRFFTNLILLLFGLRTGKKNKDKICLSFFVDSEHLDLAGLRIAEDDVYLAYWLAQLLPIYDPQNFYEKIFTANKWVRDFLPNIGDQFTLTQRFKVLNSRLGKIWKNIWEKIWSGPYGDLLESQAKGLEWQKMKISIKQEAEKNGKGVVIEEGILKFHENDARERFREEWLSYVAQN